MKSYLLSLVAIFSILGAEVSAEASTGQLFTYREVFSPQKTISIDVSERQMLFADMGSKLEVCAVDSPFICAKSSLIFFHFPKDIRPGLSSWKAGGATFKVENREKRKLLGTVEDVYSVYGKKGKLEQRYLYSVENGLLAIGFVNTSNGAYVLMVSDRACGFGAQSCTGDRAGKSTGHLQSPH